MPKVRTGKRIFIVESDPVRQKEISEALGHQPSWNLEFFDSPAKCLAVKGNPPMVVFFDIEHFESASSDQRAMKVIANMHETWPDAAVIVFCDSELEHQGAAALKQGALDYIVLNQHQYAKMESELTWLEGVLEQRTEDRKHKRILFWMSLGMILFIITMIVLEYLGLIHEGTDHTILLGD